MKIRKDHLTLNEWSRPQKPLLSTKAIVMHWVGNPSTSAQNNRDFWESRKDGGKGYGSAHLIVDDKEVLEAVPLFEMAYHVGAKEYSEFATGFLGSYPNNCTLGVEMCHPDWTGRYSDSTWQRAVRLVADLLLANRLRPHHITTHQHITGKECPRWFVHHPSEFERFRWDVDLHMRTTQ